jgi:hypothetical protein
MEEQRRILNRRRHIAKRSIGFIEEFLEIKCQAIETIEFRNSNSMLTFEQ